MNRDDVIKRGRAPWLPHPDADEMVAYHVHDNPLIGSFRRSGRSFLFLEVASSGPAALWGYVAVTEDEASWIAAYDYKSSTELFDMVAARFYRPGGNGPGQPLLFALTLGNKVEAWSECQLDVCDLFQAASEALSLFGNTEKPQIVAAVEAVARDLQDA